jgi:hypothetical protein
MQIPFFSPVPENTFADNTITDPKEREKVFGQNDHVRKYGHDYPERIQMAGLIADANPFASSLPSEQATRYGIQSSEIIYIGKKP